MANRLPNKFEDSKLSLFLFRQNLPKAQFRDHVSLQLANLTDFLRNRSQLALYIAHLLAEVLCKERLLFLKLGWVVDHLEGGISDVFLFLSWGGQSGKR